MILTGLGCYGRKSMNKLQEGVDVPYRLCDCTWAWVRVDRMDER